MARKRSRDVPPDLDRGDKASHTAHGGVYVGPRIFFRISYAQFVTFLAGADVTFS